MSLVKKYLRVNNSVPLTLVSALLYGDQQCGVMFQVIFSNLNKTRIMWWAGGFAVVCGKSRNFKEIPNAPRS